MEDVVKEEPSILKKWNWGAFMLNCVWGVGNKSYLALLCLIPFFGLIWIFVCGIKGNQWAWESGEFKSVESFENCQKTWNRAGLFAFILNCVILIAYFFILMVAGGVAAFGLCNM